MDLLFKRKPKHWDDVPWDPRRPLLQLSPRKEDIWSISDAYEGTFVTGATGGGKTSGPGQHMAKSFLRNGFGGLVLSVKRDEPDLWRKYAKATGREEQFIFFGPGSGWSFDFMQYEFSRPGAGAGHTENLVRLFTEVLNVANRKKDQEMSSEAFWEYSQQQMLRNAIDLLAIAYDRVTLPDVYDVINSAPTSLAAMESEEFVAASSCCQALIQGRKQAKSPRRAADFALCGKYWLEEFPALSDRTRSVIVTSFTSMADVFLRGELGDLFCSNQGKPLVPELCQEGAVIVLELPTKEWGPIGQLGQVLYKWIWQQAMERRDVNQHPRPVFLYADEAATFATGTDVLFQSTARSQNLATVYLVQNLPMLEEALGENDLYGLIGNLRTKCFSNNDCTVTNKWAADCIGMGRTIKPNFSQKSGSSLLDDDGPTVGGNVDWDYSVHSSEFLTLKSGGVANDLTVTTVLFKGDRTFRYTNKCYLPVGWPQVERS